MIRRDFLKLLAASSLLSNMSNVAFAQLNSQQVQEQKMLFIFLRGAYDGLNTLIPYQEELYYNSRPNIAIKPNEGIALNSTFMLHPALKDNIYPLYQQKQALFIPLSGQIDNTRSHFEAQDAMEMGDFTSSKSYSSGFLNRLIGQINKNQAPNLLAKSFTQDVSIILKGDILVSNINLKSNNHFSVPEKQLELYKKLYEGSNLDKIAKESMADRMQIEKYEKEMVAASRGAYGNFSKISDKIAKIYQDNQNLAIGFVDLGGWDTHVNQGSVEGQYANHLKDLGDGLNTFKDSMGSLWSKTTVVIISEFGRTLKENGNKGTDHGHGNTLWVLGGNINGGTIQGEWNGLNNSIHENRDLQVYNDYRSVIAYLIKRNYALNESQIQKIFPSYPKQKFNI